MVATSQLFVITKRYNYEKNKKDESCFNLWDHDGRIRVRRCAGERMDDPIFYELRVTSIATGKSLKCSLQPEVVPFLQGVPGATIFQQDRDFCSAQHMQLFPWPAYTPNMSSIEHVWD
ncbi:transposable element Tc1 transposase [Trichonephila clavipes]|nr:transposable element Tc1 transposase [Trichonephila clavipes]